MRTSEQSGHPLNGHLIGHHSIALDLKADFSSLGLSLNEQRYFTECTHSTRYDRPVARLEPCTSGRFNQPFLRNLIFEPRYRSDQPFTNMYWCSSRVLQTFLTATCKHRRSYIMDLEPRNLA